MIFSDGEHAGRRRIARGSDDDLLVSRKKRRSEIAKPCGRVGLVGGGSFPVGGRLGRCRMVLWVCGFGVGVVQENLVGEWVDWVGAGCSGGLVPSCGQHQQLGWVIDAELSRARWVVVGWWYEMIKLLKCPERDEGEETDWWSWWQMGEGVGRRY